jgi:WD40-like Beta Propeller Repeat
MSGRLALPVFALAAACALAVGAACASGSGVTASAISPCNAVRIPVWSPDGTQIGFYGTRWPPPTKAHRNPNDILQALCTMDGNGQNAQPLRYTVCSEKCADFPYQIAWLNSGELVYLIDGGLFRIAPGQKPKRFGTVNSPSFGTDSAGDRLAAGFGFPGCLTCGGPVTVLDVPSGHVVGRVGGKKYDNVYPSLSPDGSQVVFERDAADESARTFGIWTAKANGKALRQLVRKGFQPLWSPTGDQIVYRTSGTPTSGLRLVPSQGGKAKTLVARGVTEVFGWSPDGTSIAYETGRGKLAVVDVTTRTVHQLLKLYGAPTASWSPDSSTLVVSTFPNPKKCSSVWRVPADGSRSTLLRHC